MTRLIALTLVVSACTSHRVVVMGSEVHAHLGELRRTGRAQVDAQYEVDDNSYTHRPEVIRLDQTVEIDGIRARHIDDLAYTCEDQPPSPNTPIPEDTQCELLTRRDDPFLLRKERRFVGFGTIGAGVVVGVALAGFFGTLACAAGCDSPYQELSIAALGGLVIAAFVGCARSSTCHD